MNNQDSLKEIIINLFEACAEYPNGAKKVVAFLKKNIFPGTQTLTQRTAGVPKDPIKLTGGDLKSMIKG
jgi:hypothetical protein